MSKKQNIREEALTFFTQLLTDIGCTFDDDGTIRQMTVKKGGLSSRKIKIEGMDLVLPTQERLNEPEGDTIVFAPLCENVLEGESAVITTLKKLINANLNLRMPVLMSALAALAVSGDKYPAKLRALLNKNPNLREQTIKPMKKVISRVGHLPSQHILGVYLTHKNVMFNDRKVKRKATVSSTLLDDLNNGNTWTVTMPKCDAAAIAELIESIVPGVNEGEYTFGTNSTVAPNFHALMTAFYNISSRLSDVEDMVRKYIPAEALAILPEPATYEWVDGLENLYVLEKAFPSLTGNNGNVVVGKGSEADTSGVKVNEGSSSSVPSTSNVPSSAPVQEQPVPKKTGWGVPSNPVAGHSGMGVPSAVPGDTGLPWETSTPGFNQAPTMGSNASMAPPAKKKWGVPS